MVREDEFEIRKNLALKGEVSSQRGKIHSNVAFHPRAKARGIQGDPLINKISNGNEEYFEKIVNQYKNKIYNFSLNILHNKEDGQEVASEVFYRFYKELKSFKGECKISTYLYQIAKNLCRDFLKKKKHKTTNIEEIVNLIRTGSDPEQIYLKNEAKEEVLLALNNLEDRYREALILRELEGFSYKEISEILKQKLNTIKTNIKRAREQVSLQIKHLRGE